ncbi:MAG: pyrroloquinoline quinone biosynthesis protein PqqB [Candidatus Methylomirabilales bacterium]
MRIRVLGSAAGGGFPQWNCGCPNCRGVRAGTIQATPRSQESVAVSAEGDWWLLLNVSPEIRSQIEGFPALHPRGPRHSPIGALALTNGDLDRCLGLFSLRESHPLALYATDRVRAGLADGNVIFRTLQRFPDQVRWRPLKLGREEPVLGTDGEPMGLWIEAVPVPGKVPVHLETLMAPDLEDNVGLRVRDAAGRRLAYFSSIARLDGPTREAMADADCLFFDGTFWSSDELPALGLGTRRAEDMAHLPVGGEGGSLAALSGLRVGRRIYIHLNNTNPLLREDSPERTAVLAAGWEAAYDGMEVEL